MEVMAAHAPAPVLDMSKLSIPPGHALRKAPAIALIVGIVGIAASFGIGFMGGDETLSHFYFAWLVAFTFFFTIAIGGLFFGLFNYATRAGWSVTVRRQAEHFGGTLPWFLLLFIPVALGMHHLYPWTHEDHLDAVLLAKRAWLNPTFFLIRAAVILAGLAWMGWWFRKQSVTQDELGEHAVKFGPTTTTSSHRLQKASGPAIVAFALLVSFAAFDWIMSLQPHWYSTIFGGYLFAGSALTIFVLLVLVCMALQRAGFLGNAVTPEHYHDLGKLAFAFIVFWGYIAFSQFMLIWYANIPEETEFFYGRYQGSWLLASRILLFGHFLVPFYFFIVRRVKRNPVLLQLGCAYLVVLHFCDMRWLMMPVLHPEGVHLHVLDFTTLVGIGGVFTWAFLRLLVSSALIPVKDPRLKEALVFENF
jgi:hypothetical protein